jgi:hypothetical protein
MEQLNKIIEKEYVFDNACLRFDTEDIYILGDITKELEKNISIKKVIIIDDTLYIENNKKVSFRFTIKSNKITWNYNVRKYPLNPIFNYSSKSTEQENEIMIPTISKTNIVGNLGSLTIVDVIEETIPDIYDLWHGDIVIAQSRAIFDKLNRHSLKDIKIEGRAKLLYWDGDVLVNEFADKGFKYVMLCINYGFFIFSKQIMDKYFKLKESGKEPVFTDDEIIAFNNSNFKYNDSEIEYDKRSLGISNEDPFMIRIILDSTQEELQCKDFHGIRIQKIKANLNYYFVEHEGNECIRIY